MKIKYVLTIMLTCIVVFILQLLVNGFTDLFILDSSKPLEIWRYITSIFLHGDIVHLIYNMMALFFFGIYLESFLGSKKFISIYLISGIIANIITLPFYNLSLGASGAIFGIIGALIVIRPTLSVFAFGVPMPIFLAGILWGIGDLVGAAAFLAGNPINSTGNIAHLSGLFLGLILGFIFKKPQQKIRNYKIEFDENQVRNWENFYMK